MYTLLLILLMVVLPAVPWLAGFWIVRHGPWPNRFWQGETIGGFAATVTMALAIAGFVYGGLFLGNLGPPIGVIATLPVGLVAGLTWGVMRARRREA